MEGLATGSNERNELVRVRHGSDSGVGVFHTKKSLFLILQFIVCSMIACFSFLGHGILLEKLVFYACNGNG